MLARNFGSFFLEERPGVLRFGNLLLIFLKRFDEEAASDERDFIVIDGGKDFGIFVGIFVDIFFRSGMDFVTFGVVSVFRTESV